MDGQDREYRNGLFRKVAIAKAQEEERNRLAGENPQNVVQQPNPVHEYIRGLLGNALTAQIQSNGVQKIFPQTQAADLVRQTLSRAIGIGGLGFNPYGR